MVECPVEKLCIKFRQWPGNPSRQSEGFCKLKSNHHAIVLFCKLAEFKKYILYPNFYCLFVMWQTLLQATCPGWIFFTAHQMKPPDLQLCDDSAKGLQRFKYKCKESDKHVEINVLSSLPVHSESFHLLKTLETYQHPVWFRALFIQPLKDYRTCSLDFKKRCLLLESFRLFIVL